MKPLPFHIAPLSAALLAAAGLSSAAAQAPAIVSFTLINADTDQPVSGFDPVPPGAVIGLNQTGTSRLSIRANTQPAVVGSVRFSGSLGSRTENTPPYSATGDTSGDYNAWPAAPGSYTLGATPFSGSGASGSAGPTATLSFTIVASTGGTSTTGSSTTGSGTTGTSTGGSTTGSAGPSAAENTPAAGVYGEQKVWHTITVAFEGPTTSESAQPNPFLDYRLDVTFTMEGLWFRVPGYFAADGFAGETGASSGRIWRAHFAPPAPGVWTYRASFRQGSGVAVADDPLAGLPAGYFDNATGTFTVTATDKQAPDLRAKGRLAQSGRYLRHLGTGEFFLKTGADSPENLLGYVDFDGTYDHDNGSLKTYAPHIADWSVGDPTWRNGRGKGLIGALNYLAAERQNVISFLTYNAGGDGKDVWPFTSHTERLRYDCSKLDQWEIVFRYAQRHGFYLHFKTQEQENDNDSTWSLDGGNVGTQRKLYYRELIARFGHHLALNWNLGEENTQTTDQRKAMATYFHNTDTYSHLVVLHTYPGQQESVYRPLLGSASHLTGASIQIAWDQVHAETLQWILESAAAGKPWVIANDEQGSASVGVPPDPGWPGYNPSGRPSQDQVRHQVLWGNLMAGGAGVEAYFGYQTGETDLSLQNFRSRDRWWDYSRHARQFFETHLPFHRMESADSLISPSEAYCFAAQGEVYAVYLPNASVSSTLRLNASGRYDVRWFDPKNGGPLRQGSTASVQGPGPVSLGAPPSGWSGDAAVLVRLSGGTSTGGTSTGGTSTSGSSTGGSTGGQPFNGTPAALPGRVQAEHFDLGGQGVAYSDAESANLGNAFRTSEGVDIQGTSDAGAGYNVGWIRSGEWLEFTVASPSARSYTLDIRVARNPPGTSSLRAARRAGTVLETLGTVTIPSTGGWQSWTTVTIPSVTLPAGVSVLRLEATGSDFNINHFDLR